MRTRAEDNKHISQSDVMLILLFFILPKDGGDDCDLTRASAIAVFT